MGSKGGGGVDTSGLEQATRDATALQEEIFNLTREDVQPWYNMGTGAVSKLSDLLGIGGGSVQTREQLREQLMPEYTSQQATGAPSSAMVMSPTTGKTYDLAFDYNRSNLPQGMIAPEDYGMVQSAAQMYNRGGDYAAEVERLGGRLVGGAPTTQDVIDYTGLNAAIDEQMAAQGVPDDYGSLLERFGMSQFEEDPGYQFRKDEAQKALERQMAAQGVTLGGAGFGDINPQAYRAMEEMSQGLAAQEYQSAYNRYVNDQLNTFNMLTGASSAGQNATGIQAGAGQSYAQNVGQLQTGLASAQMNAQMAEASQPSMFSSLLGAGGQALGGYFSGGGTLSGIFG